jgi:hypothetical protein
MISTIQHDWTNDFVHTTRLENDSSLVSYAAWAKTFPLSRCIDEICFPVVLHGRAFPIRVAWTNSLFQSCCMDEINFTISRRTWYCLLGVFFSILYLFVFPCLFFILLGRLKTTSHSENMKTGRICFPSGRFTCITEE